MLVWRQEIHITLDEINSIYWVDPVCSIQDFKRKLAEKDDQFDWLAKIIVVGQPHLVVAKAIIQRHDLKFEARMWLDL
ncbi:hypothetical protein HAX54_047260, partial [Datura stramonium]|nr:hypothetical protein [Datura stramonium]